ncbi:MAG: HEAT repeat domain-containing protein [Anaeromyxobacter sp.]
MRHLATCLAALLLAACTPSDPAGWARKAAGANRVDDKLEALAQARKAPGDRQAAVPYLVELLGQKSARVRGEAALVLGEIGDPSATPALVAAILPGSDRDGAEANKRIAGALGQLRAREAVPALQQLATSGDAYTQVAALDALGRIGDPAAVDTLIAVATSPAVEPVTAQHALMALGRVGDPRAAPVVIRMLFEERAGASFYPQAAFAAIQIGKPMEAPVRAVLEGSDAALADWARERKVPPGALYAKAAQLLGDVGGPDSVPALLARLSYKDARPDLQLFVRVFAAESLGRLRAREAVKPLCDLLARETDPVARDRYGDALARIGDAGALPALRTAAGSGEWDLRHGPLAAVARLGGEAEVPVVEGARSGCPADQKPVLEGMLAQLAAARECTALACWAAKLQDPSAAVRDRAALEVGRAGGAADAPALAAAATRAVNDESDLAARYHALLGLQWLAGREKLGAAGGEIADKLDQMITADRGRRLTAGVNEDALRLADRLRRTAE